jgi:hypothetical protein
MAVSPSRVARTAGSANRILSTIRLIIVMIIVVAVVAGLLSVISFVKGFSFNPLGLLHLGTGTTTNARALEEKLSGANIQTVYIDTITQTFEEEPDPADTWYNKAAGVLWHTKAQLQASGTVQITTNYDNVTVTKAADGRLVVHMPPLQVDPNVSVDPNNTKVLNVDCGWINRACNPNWEQFLKKVNATWRDRLTTQVNAKQANPLRTAARQKAKDNLLGLLKKFGINGGNIVAIFPDEPVPAAPAPAATPSAKS